MYTASQQQQQQQKYVSLQIPERCNAFNGEPIVMWWAALPLLLLLITCGAAQKSPIHINTSQHSPKVCGSIDVRNEVESFIQLNDCQVLEGDLQIGFMTGLTINSAINNLTFPLLREVTGFVLLYRVNGLRSLGTLFPNLAVIRGRTLFVNFALVVYELQDLTEIGLYSLTNISRGSVRFEKNIRLCYIDTIDWNLIAPNTTHLIKENRPKEECSKCPSSIISIGCVNSTEARCWNKNHCQKTTEALDSNLQPCDEQCLGGCDGSTSRDCFACRHALLNDQCVQKCPPNTYLYIQRRCVTLEECYNQVRPRSSSQLPKYPYRPFRGECVLECPPMYMEREIFFGNRTSWECIPCTGVCKKECQGSMVDSISAAQQFTSCTHITGALEIRLRHGGTQNLMLELEKSLGSIEEIDGYLKVVRSFPLVSLNFLKSLRVIHGNTLQTYNSSFVLLDNQNLQELWVQPRNLTLKRGKIFFHFNSRLCYDKIEKFVRNAGLPTPTDSEAPRHSNGDKEACNVTVLDVKVDRIRATSVILSWNPFENYDPRILLGYVVSYVKAPYQNVTYYDGRDACGADGWTVDDVPGTSDQKNIQKIITHLEPFTQYAFFVRTYIIKYETNGGRSNISYFTTAPDVPMQVRALNARAVSSSEMTVNWTSPFKLNGILDGYLVTVTVSQDNFPDRNFCLEPFNPLTNEHEANNPGLSFPEPGPIGLNFRDDTCPCEDKTKKAKKTPDEDQRIEDIDFENKIQNYMYTKRASSSRMTRSLPEGRQDNELLGMQGKISTVMASSQPSNIGVILRQMFKAPSAVIRDLVHFTRYQVSVQACRQRLPTEAANTSALCSTELFLHLRTKKNVSADTVRDIELLRHVANDSTVVELMWTQPERPNSLIHSYQIEQTHHDKGDNTISTCVANNQSTKRMKYYPILPPGNYSFRVRAVSLAGFGPHSRYVSIYIAPPQTSGLAEAWYGVVVAIVLIGMFVIGFIWYWKRTYPVVPRLFRDINPDYVSASSVYIADDWEVPRDKIELLRELGQGSFGMVYEGIAHDLIENQPHVSCAVKTVNELANDRDRHEFLNEASVMKAFNTHHVVRLLGVVSLGQPTLVIMELMSNGDLKTYLRNHRPEASTDSNPVQPPTLKRIMQMALEIADGMAYLTAKKFVHRDLAARNCMVADDLTVKIGDFGMTRDIYETDYYKKGTKGLLPVRWMAPESLKDGVFTSRSDIWSYGVVLWEMVTLASQPYLGLSNDQVLKYVIEGGVMDRPENCPDKLYELMQLCWQHKPHLRPPFMELVTRLLPDANEAFATHSFYHSPEAQEIRVYELETQLQEYGTPLTAPIEHLDSEDFGSVCSEPCSDNEAEDSNVLALLAPSRPSAPVVSSSDSSRGSKVSNGSAQLNGYVTNTTSC